MNEAAYPFLGDATILRLPKGKGKGTANIDLLGVSLQYNFTINRVKVRGNRVEFSGRGSVNEATTGSGVSGTIKGVSRPGKGKSRTLTSVSKLEGTMGPTTANVDARIKGVKK